MRLPPPVALLLAVLITVCALPSNAQTARIEGTVTDSIHAKPLSGALVFATPVAQGNGAIRSAVTDDRGRYLIDTLRAGRYRLDFSHPLLDSLEVTLADQLVTLIDGERARIDLAVPSSASLLAEVCPGPKLGEGRGALIGRILSSDDDTPLVGSALVAAWIDLPTFRDITQLYIHQAGRVLANASGQFRFCDVPTDTWIDVQVQHEGRAGSVIPTLISDSAAIAILNVSFSPSASYRVIPSDSVPANDTTSQPLLTGTASLTGRVFGAGGRPLPDAQVRVADAAPMTRTDSLGRFVLSGLPSGTQLLEVRRIGYDLAQARVELRTGRAVVHDVRLERVISLDSVRIVAERASATDFMLRAKQGLGRFLREDEIEAKAVKDVASLISTMPGFRVQGTGLNARVYSTRRLSYFAGTPCTANVVIDGNQYLDPSMVRPSDIAAMEFYATSMGAPSTFKADCGLILIWTRKRR